ncbi:MAG: hypothetical protein ACKOI2_14800 [Actinomycetota bacterium]
MSELQSSLGALTMLLWFVGTSVLVVWSVFRDPRFDYRFLIAGVLLPDVIDGIWGGARGFHSVTMSVAVLFVVMLTTIGRRPWRKRFLAVPIGMFVHLIVDGAFDDTKVFWWPVTGLSFSDSQLPVVERGMVNVLLEFAGLALCLYAIRRFGLRDPQRRRTFLREGWLTA